MRCFAGRAFRSIWSDDNCAAHCIVGKMWVGPQGTIMTGGTRSILIWIGFAAVLTAGWIGQPASAQAPASPATKVEPAKDYNQRSLETYEFKKAAQSGPERGREIFYYKCWFCHNEFTKDIPKLTGLYQHPAMIATGAPVNDEAVKNQIRNGSTNMAAYKYTLSEADIDDLVSFIRTECCWNSDAPPHNPRYIAR
jgi:mono/diheme cytochrome c family protein